MVHKRVSYRNPYAEARVFTLHTTRPDAVQFRSQVRLFARVSVLSSADAGVGWGVVGCFGLSAFLGVFAVLSVHSFDAIHRRWRLRPRVRSTLVSVVVLVAGNVTLPLPTFMHLLT